MQRSCGEAKTAGLSAALPVATPDGWRVAGALRPGDCVWRVDGPPARIVHCRSANVAAHGGVRVPEGALGNSRVVDLLAGQPLALELDQAGLIYGDPVALIPAGALTGWRGIARRRVAGHRVIELVFAGPQVIYAGYGLLLGCPGVAVSMLTANGPPAPPLTAEQARHLMACVMAQEIGAWLRRYAAFDAAKRV